ncbi:hypothetical protein WA556_005474 [Blastocystis sp. ATCC 50177/Nand II]
MDFTLLVVIAVVAIALLWFAKSRQSHEAVRMNLLVVANDLLFRIEDGKPVVNEDAVTILLDRMKKYGIYTAVQCTSEAEGRAYGDLLFHALSSSAPSAFSRDRVLSYMKSSSLPVFMNVLHIEMVVAAEESHLPKTGLDGKVTIIENADAFGRGF